MISSVKSQLAKRLSPAMYHQLGRLKDRWLNQFVLKSFSQTGEDIILRQYLDERTTGFYVDVGAHHPKRYSNTYYFYQRGWRGINIDAMPGSMQAFKTQRPKDINLEVAIALESGRQKFFIFNEPALNTFDEALANSRVNAKFQIRQEVIIPTLPLAEILKQYLSPGQRIDFLTVDVEGMDHLVLESNDWQLFRPRFVLAESGNSTIEDLRYDPVYNYLGNIGYIAMAKTSATVLYKDSEDS